MPMVYFKPLLRGRPRPPANQQQKILHLLGKLAVEEIQKEVDKSPLKDKTAIKKSLNYKVFPSSITFWSDHPAFVFLEKGVRPHVMSYVRNKVVPIELGDLKTIPTPRDRRQGVAFRQLGFKKTISGKVLPDPRHPGYPALNMARNGIRKARKRFMDEMLSNFLQVRT